MPFLFDRPKRHANEVANVANVANDDAENGFGTQQSNGDSKQSDDLHHENNDNRKECASINVKEESFKDEEDNKSSNKTPNVNSVERKASPAGDRTRREMIFAVCAGVCLAFNSGYINGCCLSGLLTESGSIKQAVSAFTGGYTKAGLALADGDTSFFGFEVAMISSFICGAFISGFINPKAVPHQLGPTYGPTFLIGSVLLAISSILSSTHPEGKALFYFAAAANGLQNGMSSMYSANLIRTSHLTGTSTDIGLILGQMARSNFKNAWKCAILISLATSFWLGSLISFFAVTSMRGRSLLFNAVFFFLIGIGSIIFVVKNNRVTFWQAFSGRWDWDKVMNSLVGTHLSGEDVSEETLMEMFDKIDVDGSGTLDEDELFVALKVAGMPIPRSRLRSMIAAVDTDGDGEVSKEEMLQFFRRKDDPKK